MSAAAGDKAVPTAALLIIGDEILSGRTVDANIAHTARFLTARGIDLREVRVVPDVEAEIVTAVNALRGRYDLLFTTGGIGPTHDDITADAVAKALGVPLDNDARAVAMLKERFGVEGLSEARLRMARIPRGAELIANALTQAPGFSIANVHVMAGVPAIMQAMLDALAPLLPSGRPMLSRTVPADVPESYVAIEFEALQKRFPDVVMGSYPHQRDGRYHTELVLRSRDEARLAAAEDAVRAMVMDVEARKKRTPRDEAARPG
ncbi:MAG: competence/damage-inducible protein A [Bauldia sp.]|nr:competence/damage-inducible protein A [Bauldia sp.]